MTKSNIIAIVDGLQLTDDGKVYLAPLRSGSQLGAGPINISDTLRDMWFGTAGEREMRSRFNRNIAEAFAGGIDKMMMDIGKEREAGGDQR